jgi:UDP-N-acetylmuramoyl-tripeptide--D-alanyl-D-alanine ligase
MGFDWVVGVKGTAASICEGARKGGIPESQVKFLEDSDRAADFAAELCRSGDLLLVKGSRGIRMERVVERLISEQGIREE